MPSSLPENLKELITDDAERALLEDLCSEEYGQLHLLDAYAKDSDDEKLRGLSQQLLKLDGGYPGGLKSYITKAKKLLQDSKNGVNPLDGWTPAVPQGESFELGTDKYKETEAKGMELFGNVGFVLVAGGLGERLGYNGAKVCLSLLILSQVSLVQCKMQNESNQSWKFVIVDWIAYRIHNGNPLYSILRIVHLGCAKEEK